MFRTKKLYFQYWDRPGRFWSREEVDVYVDELNELAANSLSEQNNHFYLTKSKKTLSRNIILMLRDQRNELIGFSLGTIQDGNNIRKTLSPNITCIHVKAQSAKLIHLLHRRLLLHSLWSHRVLSGFWFANMIKLILAPKNQLKPKYNIF